VTRSWNSLVNCSIIFCVSGGRWPVDVVVVVRGAAEEEEDGSSGIFC
jgi:hypothetical protein